MHVPGIKYNGKAYMIMDCCSMLNAHVTRVGYFSKPENEGPHYMYNYSTEINKNVKLLCYTFTEIWYIKFT